MIKDKLGKEEFLAYIKSKDEVSCIGIGIGIYINFYDFVLATYDIMTI